MKYSRYLIALTALSLGACSGNTVKQSLGLNRQGPDEYRVVSRPPLSVPPEFNLRPPGTTEAPGVLPADKQAAQMVMGTAATGVAVKTPSATAKASSSAAAESQFLKDAGADKADPNVRHDLVEQKIEAQEIKEDTSSWWDIFDWGSSKKDQEPVVDAAGESQRIQQDKTAGQPVTAGDTPDVKQKDTGLLGDIFGY